MTKAPKIVGAYRLEAQLSATETSQLWSARKVSLNGGPEPRVTLKLVDARDEGEVKRLHAEHAARLMVQDHLLGQERHVVDVYEVSEDRKADRAYLVMENLRGGATLRDLVGSGPAGTSEAMVMRRLFQDACLGLRVVHAAGLVHCDLRPENLFVKPVENGRRLLVGGLGHACNYRTPNDSSADALSPMTAVGTGAYAAPEANQGDASPKSDSYGLAFAFYEALVGSDAFAKQFAAQTGAQGAAERHDAWRAWHSDAKLEAKPVRELCPACPADLGRAIDGMMRKDAASRLSVEEALETLGAAAAPPPSAPSPARRPAPAPSPPSTPPTNARSSAAAVLTITHIGNSSLEGLVQTFDKDAVRVGRGAENDVAFDRRDDRLVSNPHLEIRADGGQVFVDDLASKNGTFVNGKRVRGRQLVAPADVVTLGRTGPAFRLRAGAPEASSPPPPKRSAERSDAPEPTVLRPRPRDLPPPREDRPFEESDGEKSGIGRSTMLRAIGSAQETERKRTKRIVLMLAFGCVTIASIGFAAFVSQQKDMEEQIALAKKSDEARVAAVEKQHEREMGELKDKLDAGSADVARLIVEIGERDKTLKDLMARSDLSDAQRRTLVEETEKKLAALGKQLGAAEDDLRRSGRGDFSDIAKRREHAVFLIVVDQGPRGGGIGTAFAIRDDGLLATNAHVQALFDNAVGKWAVQNGTGAVFKVTKSARHPGFTGDPAGPDVALIQIDPQGEKFPAFELASAAELRELHTGAHLGTIGYPGELYSEYLAEFSPTAKKVTKAVATFKDGWVGRITDFEGRSAPYEKARWIQHSASVTGGTSGSPLFLQDGKVVALHNSGLNQKVYVEGEKGKARLVGIAAASQLNWGVRVDVLTELRDSTQDLTK